MGNVFCTTIFLGIVRLPLTYGEVEAWTRPTPYVLVGAAAAGAIIGHIFMRKGLGEYKGVFMVTIFEGAHIVAACLSGCIVMEELAHAPWWQYMLYWLSVLAIVSGVLLINTQVGESELGVKKDQPTFHMAQIFVEGDEEPIVVSEQELESMIGKKVDKDYTWTDDEDDEDDENNDDNEIIKIDTHPPDAGAGSLIKKYPMAEV